MKFFQISSMKVTIAAVVLIFSASAEPAHASMELLWNALARLETFLRGESRSIDKRELGTRIHSYHARIWDHMADMPGSAIRRLKEPGQRKDHTFLGHKGTHVFGVGHIESRPYIVWEEQGGEKVPLRRDGPGPRIEIWVEKTVGEDGFTRADRVIIDHENKRVFVSDLTTRSPNDPTLADSPARVRRHAEYHESFNAVRVSAIERELFNGGMFDYTVVSATEEGAYYETAVRRVMSEQADGERVYRRRVAQVSSASDGAGSQATRGLIGAIAVGMAINMLFPDEARGAERTQAESERMFHAMIQAYATGRVTVGDRIRAQLRGLHYDRLAALAQSFFPLLSHPTIAIGAYETFIDPYIDMLRAGALEVQQERQRCEQAELAAANLLREHQQEGQERVEAVKRAVLRQYSELTRRIQERVQGGLLPFMQEAESVRWTAEDKEALRMFVAQGVRAAGAEIADLGRSADQALSGIAPEEMPIVLPRVQSDLAKAYFIYWSGVAAISTPLSQKGILAGHHREKAQLGARYLQESTSLPDQATPAEWRELRDLFALEERRLDELYRGRLRNLYRAFAVETADIAGWVSRLTGGDTQMSSAMTRLDDPNALISKLEAQLGASFDVLTYQNVPPEAAHYTDDEALLTIRARPLLEARLSTVAGSAGTIRPLAFWINNDQKPLAEMKEPISEGARLTIWAEMLEPGADSGEHDWPIGPPPVGGLGFREMTWEFPGGRPAEASGHVFRTQIPVTDATAPYTRTLRALRPGASGWSQRLEIKPNAVPSFCLFELPEKARVNTEVMMRWLARDTDGIDELTLTVEPTGGQIVGINPISGWPVLDAGAAGPPASVTFSGSHSIEGDARVSWRLPAAQPGVYEVRATVSDGVHEVTQTREIEIVGNTPPRITGIAAAGLPGAGPIEVGDEILVRYSAIDEDEGDQPEFYIAPLPAGLEMIGADRCEEPGAGQTSCLARVRGLREGYYTYRVAAVDQSRARNQSSVEIKVGSPPPPADCSRIDCDCASINVGLAAMTAVYRRECRAAERGLLAQCQANKVIDGACHPTAHGPNAWPQ